MRSIIEKKPNSLFIVKSERTMVPHKSNSVGNVGHILSKESLKNNADIKNIYKRLFILVTKLMFI
jgi:hypothetical protein